MHSLRIARCLAEICGAGSGLLEPVLYPTLDAVCSAPAADSCKAFWCLLHLFPRFPVFCGIGSLRGIAVIMFGRR